MVVDIRLDSLVSCLSLAHQSLQFLFAKLLVSLEVSLSGHRGVQLVRVSLVRIPLAAHRLRAVALRLAFDLQIAFWGARVSVTSDSISVDGG